MTPESVPVPPDVLPVPAPARRQNARSWTTGSWLTGSWSTVLMTLLLTGALWITLLAPVAKADDLTDRRDRLDQQVAQTRTDLNESGAALTEAAVAVERAQGRLAQAQTQLARTQQQLSVAKARDLAMAAKLKQARADLAAATAAVRVGQEQLDAEKLLAGEVVRQQYQQQTNLAPLAVLTDPTSTSDLATRMQWATTMFDTTGATIDKLVTVQRQLKAAQARQAGLQAQISTDRAAAATSLKVTRQLHDQARTEASAVTDLLAQRRVAQRAAASDAAADESQYASLTRERSAVEQRIATRVAKAKARAKAREQAEARARAEAGARARARARAEAAARSQAKAEAEAKAKAEARVAAAHRAKPHHVTQGRQRVSKATSHATSPARAQAQSAPVGRAAPVRRARAAVKAPRRSQVHRIATRARARHSSAHHGFIYPTNGPITSPFGMRFHPVLHVWKLHDGTDFGAGCGAPIRAAYAGRVAERYFNAGYGNRLIIDHGRVDGRYVSTAYNHAIRYVVSPGQHVSRGQVIGYVGQTGYATGCHLHLMVYLDGAMVNPMTWY